MTHTGSLVLIAAVWAAGAGVLVWLVTIPLRRTFAGQLASPVLIGTFASLAAIVGSQRAMFYASDDFRVALVVAVAAGMLAAATAFLGAQSLTRDKRAVARAVQAVGEGRLPETEDRPMHTEMQTLRRQVEQTAHRLAEASERERGLENARRELIAWVSHDLRTPLAGLRAMAEALEDGLVETPERYYKQIRVDVDTLTEMVDDLFELSRIQAGALRLSAERIGLDDMVSDCVAALEPLARVHAVRLTGRSTGAATVVGDSRELNRALTNLVVNAIRHTHDGGTVDIEVRSEIEPGPPAGAGTGTGTGAGTKGSARIAVIVQDECGGIPTADLSRVFDVGFRGEPARTPDPGVPGGAGLGLAITRGIVEAHDGTVDVHNTPNGCRFVLSLPAAS